MATSRALDVPGAHLHYEVRGTGPVLLLVGSPMAAAPFAPLADALAENHTVVTHDPRGISGSRLDDPDEDTTVEQRADDVAAILDAVGARSADLFGSSGGAITGLALITRHPGRVRTLVAHEPPVMELLPEAAERRAVTEDIIETFRREGQGPAFAKFLASIGMGGGEGAPGPQGEPSEQDIADGARFLGHDMKATAHFVPDIAAVTAGSTQVVVGVGATSGGQLAHRTGVVLAERLGPAPVVFPGDHGGFLSHPAEFAEVLRKVLAA